MGRILMLGRLVRTPNLLIAALTQTGIYFFVLLPALPPNHANSHLPAADLMAMVAATLLAAMGGYIVNDILDAPIDALNRPRQQVVGPHITPKMAWIGYSATLASTLLLSAWLSVRHGMWPALLFPGVCAALLLYAWRLKCTPLAGNILVAILCALVPIVPLMGVQDALRVTPMASDAVYTFALFAGASNLFREQVKDLQDVAGDAATGCRTLPVAAGAGPARSLALTTGVALFLLLLVQTKQHTFASLSKTLALMPALLLNLMAVAKTAKAQGSADYAVASLTIKWLIIIGFITLVIFQNT
jgi:4-hydroxybenzoate polyprenyltransferase